MRASLSRRRQLLDEVERLRKAARDRSWGQGDPSTPVDHGRLAALYAEYLAGLPAVPISRCPFCGSVVELVIDVDGLDGLWWDHDQPVRPAMEPRCEHFLALAGAMKLDRAHVESTSFLVVTGPEAPFVVPAVLAPSTHAVASSIAVGAHTAFPIVYFASPVRDDARRVNTWGTSDYRFVTAAGDAGWGQEHYLASDYDFDLRPWLAAGALSYIVAGDAALALHADPDGCPFLELPGRREDLKVRRGRVWARAEEL